MSFQRNDFRKKIIGPLFLQACKRLVCNLSFARAIKDNRCAIDYGLCVLLITCFYTLVSYMLKADPSEFSLSCSAFFCLHGLIIKLLVSHCHMEQSYQTRIDLESWPFFFVLPIDY